LKAISVRSKSSPSIASVFARRWRRESRHRRIAIVALARKLLIAFWRFATFGEIPEGATLKIA
jgi:transposase